MSCWTYVTKYEKPARADFPAIDQECKILESQGNQHMSCSILSIKVSKHSDTGVVRVEICVKQSSQNDSDYNDHFYEIQPDGTLKAIHESDSAETAAWFKWSGARST